MRIGALVVALKLQIQFVMGKKRFYILDRRTHRKVARLQFVWHKTMKTFFFVTHMTELRKTTQFLHIGIIISIFPIKIIEDSIIKVERCYGSKRRRPTRKPDMRSVLLWKCRRPYPKEKEQY